MLCCRVQQFRLTYGLVECQIVNDFLQLKSERQFLAGRLVINKLQSHLHPLDVDTIIFLYKNMKPLRTGCWNDVCDFSTYTAPTDLDTYFKLGLNPRSSAKTKVKSNLERNFGFKL